MRKLMIAFIVGICIFTLGACGNKADNNDENEPEQEQEFSIGEDETVDSDEVVAVVNDKDITGDLYNVVYTQTKINLANMGQDVEEELDVIQEATMEQIVNQELIRQNAEESGITVSDDEVEGELAELKTEDEDEFHEFLETYDLKEDAFKDQISFALYHDKFLESEVSASVSDEEIEETYEDLKKQKEASDDEEEEFPSFDDVKDQLHENILQQKEQEELMDIVDELKDSASIEMKL